MIERFLKNLEWNLTGFLKIEGWFE